MEKQNGAGGPKEDAAQSACWICSENEATPVYVVVCVCRIGDLPCGPAHWKPTFPRPPVRAHILYTFAPEEERDDEQHKENGEQDFSEARRHACEAGKAEHRRDYRHNQECNGPTQHNPFLTFFSAAGLWFLASFRGRGKLGRGIRGRSRDRP